MATKPNRHVKYKNASTSTASRRRATTSPADSDDVANVYKHICKVEYSHTIDRGVLHQLRLGVLRIDVDLCSVHELQIFKGFFSRLPKIGQLCIAKNQVPTTALKQCPKRPNVVYGSTATYQIKQSRINALKKAIQGTLHLVCRLLSTPRQCRLVSLALPGMHLTEATVSNFESAFKACTTLREIDFRDQDLSRPTVAERVIRAIASSSTVQAVCLKRCKLGSRSARYVGHLLRKNNERREQLIWKGELRGEAVSKQAIRLQGLMVLDVSSNNFGPDGTQEILEVLENDRWMVGLNLACREENDPKTLKHFRRCFKVNRESPSSCELMCPHGL